MKESTNDINEIIIRYLDGSAALEEKMLLLRWLKQSDGNRDDFAVTRDLWLSCKCCSRKRVGGRYRFGETERPYLAGAGPDGKGIAYGEKNVIGGFALDAGCCRIVAFVGNRLWHR